MSTSAADYYKLSYLKESQAAASAKVTDAESRVADVEEYLARVQAEVARCKKRLKTQMDIVASTNNLIKEAETELDDACKSGGTQENNTIFDPNTGLKVGEKITLVQDDGHMEYLTAMSNARELMAEGSLEEAMDAEKIATTLGNMREYALEPRAMFVPMSADSHTHTVQVNTAGFIAPRAMPESVGVIDETLSHAIELYEDGILDDPCRFVSLFGGALLGQDRSNLPNDVNASVLMGIFGEIRDLQKCHEEIKALQTMRIEEGTESAEYGNGSGEGEEEDGGEDVDDEVLDSEGEDDEMGSNDDSNDTGAGVSDATFEMDENGWSAVKIAIENKVSRMKEANAKELVPPTLESSKIARYNPNAHFKFVSNEANSEVDHLADSLLNCKLRSRPMGYSKENPTHGREPFKFWTYQNSGFDIDGDIIALCGDKLHNEIRDSENFVGFQHVPCPVNLENSTTLCDLRDSNNSNEPWDSNTVQTFKGTNVESGWFEECIADADNNMVWASCSRRGIINGFLTENPASGPIAKLNFQEKEVKACSRFFNGKFDLVRCGTTIIGSGGTGRLSAWNINTAVNDYSNAVGDGSGNLGSEPRIMPVDDDCFDCGDLQCVGDSQLLVAPLRADGGNGKSSTVRLYDINAESVAGLFCGTTGEISVGKQYCVKSHSSMFAMTNSTGVVFDVRTYQPTIALHTDGSCEQILGVPTNTSAPVAFTYGSRENIMCWDLRMPGSHVYTMATGNTIVKSLLWHEGTSSLIATTRSNHVISYGRSCTGYMYGDNAESDAEDEIHQDGYWPARAVHEKSYFGTPWHCDSQTAFAMLQYSFQRLGGMHQRHS